MTPESLSTEHCEQCELLKGAKATIEQLRSAIRDIELQAAYCNPDDLPAYIEGRTADL